MKKFFYRLFPFLRPWSDYKTSEVLQLILDNFQANDRNVFLCIIAASINQKLVPVLQRVLEEHGISIRGDWVSHGIDRQIFGDSYWRESIMIRNTARVVFLQLAIEKYKKLGD